jgi:flavin reductase (DIM6/NTAB) family NADH-FMN oxidoreductase RutF
MAGVSGELVGPFPEGVDPEEYDKLRRRVLWTMPYGLYVVGAAHESARQFMTLNWATQLSFVPKLVGIAVEREAVTHGLIHDGGAFTLCCIDREDRAIVRKFVKPAEVDLAARTINGFGFHEEVTGSPVLDQSVAWIDCQVHQEVVTGGHTLFVGEVVACGFQKPEETPVLRMEDTRMNYGG